MAVDRAVADTAPPLLAEHRLGEAGEQVEESALIEVFGGPNPQPGYPALLCQPKTSIRADRKSTRLNSSHLVISYAVFCLKKKKNNTSIHIFSITPEIKVYNIHSLFRNTPPSLRIFNPSHTTIHIFTAAVYQPHAHPLLHS